MRIIRAKNLGMCFGVRDAITVAIEKSKERPLTVFGELVHNETVLASLHSQGIRIERRAGDISTPDVMITAHGASERTLGMLRARGFKVSEATCPLVHFAHRAIRRLVMEGYHPVIVGKRDHVEVLGITEDLAAYDVILDEEDVGRLVERPRFGVAAQTTQPIEKVNYLVALIRDRFPDSEVRLEDTVCQPTKQRQQSAVEIAQASDVVLVVGGAHSNNTRELAATCRRYCLRVYHVQSRADLRREWFNGDETVGLTAGTSTPDVTIESVESWLRALAAERQPGEGRRAVEPLTPCPAFS